MKKEQKRIETELGAIDERLRATSLHFEEVEASLNQALALAENWQLPTKTPDQRSDAR